jgi:steroid 5-alpha reductase family enzyme
MGNLMNLKILVYTALIHFAVMLALWAIGRGHKNDSVLDIYWGFSFVIAVWMAFGLSGAESSRAKLVVALVTVWGARLGYHLFSRWARIQGLGGDVRYQDIKDKLSASGGYAMKALLLVYIPMWLCYVISQLNMMLLIMTPVQAPLGMLDYVCAGIMVCAIILEVTADLQLDAFKANHANEGRVLNTGVWAWSRHPNYFANFCCFWAIFGISMQVPGLWWTIISPLFMSWLLIGFTGKKWMDDHMKRRRPGYLEYISSTSGFVPLPPRRRTG